MVERLGLFDEPRDWQVLALDPGEQVRPGGQWRPAAAGHEGLEPGLGRREGVGFVLNAADGDERHGIFPDRNAVNVPAPNVIEYAQKESLRNPSLPLRQ